MTKTLENLAVFMDFHTAVKAAIPFGKINQFHRIKLLCLGFSLGKEMTTFGGRMLKITSFYKNETVNCQSVQIHKSYKKREAKAKF